MAKGNTCFPDEFVFEPNYVLAYGPFDAFNPLSPNDPSCRPIDYCIYLYPTHGRLSSQSHFVYGGFHIHPVQIEDLPDVVPASFIGGGFDRRSISFLGAITELFRQGATPAVKLRIPRRLMAYPTWAEPNLFGNLVHHAPHVEALLRIASEYVHNPLGTSAQVFRHVYPEFDMFEDFRITCICPDCEDYRYSDDEEEDDSDMNEDTNSLPELQSAEDAEEEELAPELSEPLAGSPIISRPHSAPPQLPPSPRSRPREIVQPEDITATERSECNPKEEQTQYESSETTIDPEHPTPSITLSRHDSPLEMSSHDGLDTPVPSFRPVVLATTMGPLRPLPPPFFEATTPRDPSQYPLALTQCRMIQDIDSRNPRFEIPSYEQPVMCNPDIPSVAIPPPVTTENPSSLMHSHQMQEAVFEPAYVLAYGPFEAPILHGADNPPQSFDYRIYLHPSSGQYDPQREYIYGGSNIHPAQLETFSEMLPPLYFLEELDDLGLQFLNSIVDLYRSGPPSYLFLHIPYELMRLPMWEGPNTLGNVVRHSAYIESLLHIASSYVHHPLGTYSQILRRLRPNFDPFGDYRLTCVCLECNRLDSNGEEETDELMSDWSDVAEESSGNTISTSSSIESLAILRPRSAPPELPSSPRTRLHEILEDERSESQGQDQPKQPEDVPTSPQEGSSTSSQQYFYVAPDAENADNPHGATTAEQRTELLDQLIKELQQETNLVDPVETNAHLSEILQILRAPSLSDTSQPTILERDESLTAYSTTPLSAQNESEERVEFDLVEERDSPQRGILGTDVGILGYGPFNSTISLSDKSFIPEYRFYLHRTNEHDTLDLFAYGGPYFKSDKEVLLYRLPTSPYVRDSSLDITEEEHMFFEEVEAYLAGEKHLEGIPIPWRLLGVSEQVIPGTAERPCYRFPHFEKIISTIAARFAHVRFARPSSRRTLEGLRHLVLPTYPLNHNNNLFKLRCPEIPYLLPEFEPDEPRHPDDTGENLPIDYYGCLSRREAFIFQQTYPRFSDILYYTAVTTREMLNLHAQTTINLPAPAEVDWDSLLDSVPFHMIFSEDRTPEALLNRIQMLTPGVPNLWMNRVPYIIQSCRQISLLIQQLETFFQTLGFRGLRELANKVALNTYVSFTHNPLLDTDEASYLTAAYDFFLREHRCSTANEILNILHLPFSDPYQLFLVREHIVDVIDPPPFVYSLHDGDRMDLVEEET